MLNKTLGQILQIVAKILHKRLKRQNKQSKRAKQEVELLLKSYLITIFYYKDPLFCLKKYKFER